MGPQEGLGYVRDGWSHGEILLKVVCCGSLNMMLIIWFQVILVRAVGSEDYICMQCMDLIFTIPLYHSQINVWRIIAIYRTCYDLLFLLSTCRGMGVLQQ